MRPDPRHCSQADARRSSCASYAMNQLVLAPCLREQATIACVAHKCHRDPRLRADRAEQQKM